MDKKYILIDVDDTLWENGIFFNKAEERFASLLEKLGSDKEEVKKLVHIIDINRIETHGFGAIPYIQTFFAVYKKLYPYGNSLYTENEILARIEDIKNELLNHPIIFLKGVKKGVKNLYDAGHSLYFYTRGEKTNQSDKIIKSGIKKYFSGEFIIPDKNKKVLSSIIYTILNKDIKEKIYKPNIKIDIDYFKNKSIKNIIKKFWVIGNSPAADINPSLEFGLNAVLVRHRNTWEIDDAKIIESKNFFKADTFLKAVKIINKN